MAAGSGCLYNERIRTGEQKKAVCRGDAEDPGRAKLKQSEDACMPEGTVRHGILLTLNLAGEKNCISVTVKGECRAVLICPVR